MHKYLFSFALLFCVAQSQAQCPVGFYFSANGLEVFFNPSNPNVDSSFWDFGDGTNVVTDQPSVTHTYLNPGTYNICLGTTGVGCTGDTCIEIMICGYIANYTVEINGSVAAFQNLSTGNYNSFSWDFGDGYTSTDTNAIHSYNTPGTYTACIYLAFGPNQCITSYCEDVTILGGGPCTNPSQIDSSVVCSENISVCSCNGTTYASACEAYYYGGATAFTLGACPNCQASFSPSANGLAVTFINTSLGTNVAYTWDFGDGQTSNDSLPVHTYATDGSYLVCLTIANGTVCNAVTCDTVTVVDGNNCTPSFAIFGTCDSAVFVNTSTGGYDQFAWNINNIPTLNADTMVLTDTGTYAVCMSLIGDSCSGNYCDTFKIHAPNAFRPGFDTDFTLGNAPVTVDFTGIDTAGFATSYTWDFGDGGSSTNQNPTHVFDSCSVNVCLTVSDVFGCSETYCDSLYICNVSIRSVNNDNSFSLYPNPGKDICYLMLKKGITGNARLIVSDITGRVVSERTVADLHKGKTISVNTAQYAQGCYFFNIVSQQQTTSLRWIKE